MKTIEELRKIAIEGRLQEKAQDDLGIYPQGAYDEKNNYTPRTEWQNGWNAAVMEQTKNVCAYHDFLGTLTKEQRTALEDLLLDNIIELSKNDDKTTLWLNVNDIFYTAADGEDFSIEDLPLLAGLQSKYGFDGVIAWVAKKRNLEPLSFKFKKTTEYIAAETELNGGIEKSKSLIQKVLGACGL